MDKFEKIFSFLPSNYGRSTRVFWLKLATFLIVLGMIASVTTSFWGSGLFSRFSNSNTNNAIAASALVRRVYVPYFNNAAVPFNQTAIFWFGKIDSSHVYADIRIGYNSTELYIDVRIIDRYLWYDTNKKAPDLNFGDNASVYLNTMNNGTLDATSYKLQTAVNGYIQQNTYQKAYTGSGGNWTAANIPFTPVYWWRGHGFNGVGEDKGWSETYHIPFSSLGMANTPSQGTLWKLAIRVHNRNDAANTPIPDTWWPESGSEANPSGWGDLVFGLEQYQPPQVTNVTTFTVRNKLNNQVVTDGMVGGSLGCGGLGLPHWDRVGYLTYPGAIDTNIQNEADMSDWNCFSKWYMTFPLSALPNGKGIVNATVTMYEYGNAGVQGQPNPSYIQVAVVNEDWNPSTLSWNTAPYVKENIVNIFVPTKSKPIIPWPGLAITWNVSFAVADAYASGQPLRLVFYDTDNQYDTGKYFKSSYVGDWDAAGRPTLNITLGTPV